MNNMKHIGMTYTRDDGEVVKVNIEVRKSDWTVEFSLEHDIQFRQFVKDATMAQFMKEIIETCENMDIVPF